MGTDERFMALLKEREENVSVGRYLQRRPKFDGIATCLRFQNFMNEKWD